MRTATYITAVIALWLYWLVLPRLLMGRLPAPAGQSQCETDTECYGHGGYELAGHIEGWEYVGATRGDLEGEKP